MPRARTGGGSSGPSSRSRRPTESSDSGSWAAAGTAPSWRSRRWGRGWSGTTCSISRRSGSRSAIPRRRCTTTACRSTPRSSSPALTSSARLSTCPCTTCSAASCVTRSHSPATCSSGTRTRPRVAERSHDGPARGAGAGAQGAPRVFRAQAQGRRLSAGVRAGVFPRDRRGASRGLAADRPERVIQRAPGDPGGPGHQGSAERLLRGPDVGHERAAPRARGDRSADRDQHRGHEHGAARRERARSGGGRGPPQTRRSGGASGPP